MDPTKLGVRMWIETISNLERRTVTGFYEDGNEPSGSERHKFLYQQGNYHLLNTASASGVSDRKIIFTYSFV